MNINEIVLPLDLTATAHRVLNERINTRVRNKLTTTLVGVFYEKDLVVKRGATVLVKDRDYFLLYPHEDINRISNGLKAYRIIHIKDSFADVSFTVDYYHPGFPFSHSNTKIKELIDQLTLDNTTASLATMLSVPECFSVAKHRTSHHDVYGYEYLNDALDSIISAVLHSNAGVKEQLRALLDSIVADVRSRLWAHIGDKGNPHKLTAGLIGGMTKAQFDALILTLNSEERALAAKFVSLVNAVSALMDALAVIQVQVSENWVRAYHLDKDATALMNRYNAATVELNRLNNSIYVLGKEAEDRQTTDADQQTRLDQVKSMHDNVIANHELVKSKVEALDREDVTQRQLVDAMGDRLTSVRDNDVRVNEQFNLMSTQLNKISADAQVLTDGVNLTNTVFAWLREHERTHFTPSWSSLAALGPGFTNRINAISSSSPRLLPLITHSEDLHNLIPGRKYIIICQGTTSSWDNRGEYFDHPTPHIIDSVTGTVLDSCSLPKMTTRGGKNIKNPDGMIIFSWAFVTTAPNSGRIKIQMYPTKQQITMVSAFTV